MTPQWTLGGMPTAAPAAAPMGMRGLLDSGLLGSIGQGLLSAGGYTTMPVSTGQGLAQGLQLYRLNQQRAIEQQLARERLDAYQQARVAEQQERQRLEQQRQAQRLAIEQAAAQDPRFAQIAQLATVPGFEDQAAQYMFRLATQQPEQPETKVVAGNLVNAQTGEVIYSAPVQRSPEPLVAIYDENSPTGQRLVPRSQAVGMATGKVDRPEGPKPTDISSLRREYTGISKNWISTRNAYEKINASRESGPGDISLLFGYMKMLDPGSVVREGEFATAEQASGVGPQVLNLYNRLVRGERLTPAQRQEFKAQARDLLTAAAQGQLERENEYRGIAESQGIQPAQVVRDVFGKYRALGSVMSGATPAPAPGPVQRQPVSVNLGGDMSGKSTDELLQMLR